MSVEVLNRYSGAQARDGRGSVPMLDLRPAPPETKHLPANIEAEQALLGVLLYDNAAFERLSDTLQPTHFFEPFHGRLFGAIQVHVRRGHLAEPILIAEQFGKDPAFGDLGGIRYLADLVDRAPPAANAADYARVIYDLALRRELIRVAGEIDAEARASDCELDAAEQLASAEGRLFALAEVREGGGGFQDFGAAAAAAITASGEAYERGGGVSGLSTGLIDLDRKLGGLHPSDLVIIGARPSMGKTGLATTIAYNVAKEGSVVGFFSLEMSAEQLATRILSSVSGIESDRIRRGDFGDPASAGRELGKLRDSHGLVVDLPLHIDATGGISIAKLAARARRLKRTKGLDLLIVDYLQLVTDDSAGRGDNRVNQLTRITGALKALAKELGVPLVALAQLSRRVEERDDKRPQLSDLRESGSIEQDADVVMFIYREAYYLGRSEPKDAAGYENWVAKMEACKRVAEIIIGKQRHGPIGTVKLSFDEDRVKFGNLARDASAPQGRLYYADDE